MNKFITFNLFMLSIVGSALAQVPTHQDCLGAIPVCQEVYFEEYVATSAGNYTNEINKDITCTDVEKSSIWYTFTVSSTGNFGFIITPNNPSDDYDWALFNITGGKCGAINSDPTLLVSCNATGANHGNELTCDGPTGATGSTPYNWQKGGCGENPPTERRGFSPFNDLIPVTKGHTYALMISNWKQSKEGYKLDFGISEVGVFDNDPPKVVDMNFPQSCQERELLIHFSEGILCNSVQTENFELRGPNGATYPLAISSNNCDIGATTTQGIRLTTDTGLINAGIYTLAITSDGVNHFLDNCGNSLAAGTIEQSFQFNTPGLPILDLGIDTVICNSIQLSATQLEATYSWQDGSTEPTHSVAATGTYKVTVTNACGTTQDEIHITYLPLPKVDLGPDTLLCPDVNQLLDATNLEATYEWQNGSTSNHFQVNQAGVYSVVAMNQCGVDSDTIQVEYREQLQVNLGRDTLICDGQPLLLSAYNEEVAYAWQDGSAEPTHSVSATGTYKVTVTNTCGITQDEIHITYLSPPKVELGPDTLLCPDANQLLDATNLETTYEWQDGSTSDHFSVNQAGVYSVVATNQCGVDSDTLQVEYRERLQINLGRDTIICDGHSLLLSAYNEEVAYTWQNGNAVATFLVDTTGSYSVTVTNSCESISDTRTIQLLDGPPVIDWGEDQTPCPEEELVLDVYSKEATYLWSDGSTSSDFYITESGRYKVSVSNACGSTEKEIYIDYIEPLSIDLGKDFYLCAPQATLKTNPHRTATFEWNTGEKEQAIEITTSGTYELTATTICEEQTVMVEVNPCEVCELSVPNVFSPNNDGNNDYFHPFIQCDVTAYQLFIFDRWGNYLFHSNDIQVGWDGLFNGRPVSRGVYIWKMEYAVVKNGIHTQEHKMGDITVFR